jgi:hypothetical protein
MSKYKRYWELRSPNPVVGEEQMFKCIDCGAETFHDKGWDGEPAPHKCGRD